MSQAPQKTYNLTTMKVSEIGEFGLIEHLIGMINDSHGVASTSAKGFRVVIGAGDDAMVAEKNGVTELASTDTLVENIHFSHSTTSWEDLGWKALAVNLSDIAAMGGIPTYALVTLGLVEDTEVEDITELYKGMLEIAHEFNVSIVGGDVVRSPVSFITVSVSGTIVGEPLLRSVALPGDQIGISGPLGAAAAGLKILQEDPNTESAPFSILRQSLRRPRPCVTEGQILIEEGVRAAIDISDGLIDDLEKLCKSSSVSAEIEAAKVPVHPDVKLKFPDKFLEFGLNGGDDYKLLFTASPVICKKVLALLPNSASLIGTIGAGEPGKVNILSPDNNSLEISRQGWDHFT